MKCLNYLKLKDANPSIRTSESNPDHHHIIKVGFYLRESDHARIQRYRCKSCKTNFSYETLHPCRYQKKRHLNRTIFEHYASGQTQRRLAKLIRVNRKTAVRKFRFLGAFSIHCLRQKQHLKNRRVSQMVVDDVITFEHTKPKQLSITMAVENHTRYILGFRISSMPTSGLLAEKARQKYGRRIDERNKNRKSLFKEIRPYVLPKALIKSDKSTHYWKDLKRYFPDCKHETYKGRKGCVVGQGELKSGTYDPLFSFNHTAAMLRANVSRLFRRTWNTTKKATYLEYHVAIYSWFHNCCLT